MRARGAKSKVAAGAVLPGPSPRPYASRARAQGRLEGLALSVFVLLVYRQIGGAELDIDEADTNANANANAKPLLTAAPASNDVAAERTLSAPKISSQLQLSARRMSLGLGDDPTPEYVVMRGYLGGGSDIKSLETDVSSARKWCNAHKSCAGFSFALPKAGDAEAVATSSSSVNTKLSVWFKPKNLLYGGSYAWKTYFALKAHANAVSPQCPTFDDGMVDAALARVQVQPSLAVQDARAAVNADRSLGTGRICCLLHSVIYTRYTYEIDVDKVNAASQAWHREGRRAQRLSWAARCDRAFFFAATSGNSGVRTRSNPEFDDEGIETIWLKLKHAKRSKSSDSENSKDALDALKLHELYQAMLRGVLSHAHRHLSSACNYFLVAPNDAYVVIDNLRHLLKERIKRNSAPGLYIGRPFQDKILDTRWNSVRAGYVIDEHALMQLAPALAAGGLCKKSSKLVGAQAALAGEDSMVGECLERLGILPEKFGAMDLQVFCPLMPAVAVAYRSSKQHWLTTWTQGTPRTEGQEAVRPFMVSFGRVPPRFMYALHNLLFNCKASMRQSNFVQNGEFSGSGIAGESSSAGDIGSGTGTGVAPGVVAEPDGTWVIKEGYLGGGHDILQGLGDMSLAQAKHTCATEPKCVGFAYHEADVNPTHDITPFFKSHGVLWAPSHEWRTFMKEDDSNFAYAYSKEFGFMKGKSIHHALTTVARAVKWCDLNHVRCEGFSYKHKMHSITKKRRWPKYPLDISFYGSGDTEFVVHDRWTTFMRDSSRFLLAQPYLDALLPRIQLWQHARSNQPRIFCVIYTMAKNHATACAAQKKAWLHKCDGHMFFSTAADIHLPAVKVEHEGKEEYNNMWRKLIAIWRMTLERWGTQYDYFIAGGEDLFVLVDNLRKLLLSTDVQALDVAGKGVLLGRRYMQTTLNKAPYHIIFPSGAPGYVMNKVALRKLVDGINNNPKCQAHINVPYEDAMTAACLKLYGVLPLDTRDEQGRERFHSLTPAQTVLYRSDPYHWFTQFTEPFERKEGLDCCATDSISFHYVKPKVMLKLGEIFHGGAQRSYPASME